MLWLRIQAMYLKMVDMGYNFSVEEFMTLFAYFIFYYHFSVTLFLLSFISLVFSHSNRFSLCFMDVTSI
jgi:hypothetical protein